MIRQVSLVIFVYETCTKAKIIKSIKKGFAGLFPIGP